MSRIVLGVQGGLGVIHPLRGRLGERIAEFEEHGAALDGVESVVVDGRDPSLRLVRTRLRAAKGERVVVIGVRFVEGRWRVVRI